jgi:hypothetical protein
LKRAAYGTHRKHGRWEGAIPRVDKGSNPSHRLNLVSQFRRFLMPAASISVFNDSAFSVGRIFFSRW